MRTTLTIDDDLAANLESERKRKGLSLNELVNLTLRQGLASEQALQKVPRLVTRPHAFGFKAGIDLDKLNQM